MTFILIFFFSLIHSFSLQKTTIIVVQDLPNFPPYETNGEGPSFLDSSSRFLEITNKTDDIEHPDMPDSEPDILIEMQLKVSQFLGLSPNISTNNSNSTFEFPHFLQKPFNTPSETLQNSFEMAHFTEAWASSVYTYKPLSSQHSFSAINAVIGFSYWCSTGLHLKNQIVVWEGVFEYSKRLSHLWIRWAYAPGSFRILSTNDGSNWEELIPWKSGFKGVLWQWLAKVFWWWRWFYKSYSEYVPFPTPIWGKRLRIQMKDPAFNFFGIYRVEAWIKEWTVMLKTAAQSDNEGCLIMADGSGKDHRELQLMDCTEAIAAGDGRELWTLHNNFQITSYVGGKCIEAAEGDVSDGARIQINDCWMSESAGDGREKWLMDHEGLTKLYKEQSKCMTVLTNSDLENVCLNVKAFASNTMNDGQHEAHMAVDGYQDNFWASSPGVEEAIFTMLFQEPKTVKELEIYWKYPAEEFEVLGLITQNLWENIEFVRNSGKTVNVNKVSLLSRNLWGLKIVMLKTRDKFNEQSIYGINDVRCISGTKSVKLKNCHELEDLKTNKFLMEDVGFVDLTAGPRLMMQKVSLNEKTNKLMSLVNVLVGFPKIIYKLLEKGNEIQKIISKLEEKMKGLDIKMSIYRGFLDSEHSNILSSIGSSSLNPIRDCSYVHKAYPHKSNGFYWIKPECSKIALRVFCNFNLNAGKSYAFLGEQAKESTSIPNLKTHIDIQNECAKLGLFPIEIISASELTTIRKYIKALGVNMAENQVIPLGFDWGCLLGACTGRFRSFNSENSLDLSEEFLTNLDSTNVLNMPFNVNGYIKDSVGIGIDNDAGYVLFKLDQFSIKGLLCSSDSNESFEQEFIKSDCFTTARGNQDFDGIQNTKIKVICPAGCAKYNQNKVWGKGIYKDDSAICRAAIHQGLITNNEGGRLEIELAAGSNNYEGTFENGIHSDIYEMQWDRSIILSKYDIVCPIDKFLRKNPITSSFLEISTEGILNEQNNIQINKTSIKSQRLKYIETEEEATIIHPKVPPTDKAMETIARIYGIQEDTLKKNLKLAKDSDLLVKQIKELMSPLLNKNLNNEYLFNKLKVLDDHNKGSLKLLDYLTEFTQIKLRWLEQENQKLKIEKLKSLKYEAYHEQYSFPLSESYEIFDHPQALSSPSKWSYSKNNLLGHENAITQTSNINCLDPNGCTASFLILKYKEYYDGLIETSILLRDSDTMGILFRYKDAFNYYAFEMKQQGRGWKRIRKVVKGVSSIVSYVEDGGYLQNIWYKVILIFRSDEFIVKMAQENLNLPTDSIPIVIRTESQELKRGRVGFLTNGEQVFYIDGFSVKPLDCITEPEIPDIRYLPPECSRFKENYYGQMNLRWNVVNPENFFDGPALWDFETDFLGKEKVIYQKTGIFSPSPEKIATFAVLNFDKFCRNGVISVEFFAQNQGMVGVAFKYINSNNYYILEIGGDENKFIQMRKRINGKYSIISKNESIGYQIKQWHRVSIVMMDSIYTIYFSNVGEAPISIFDAIENKDLPEGTIALSTYKTEAAFDNVKISPFTDWMQGNTDLLHSNQEAGLYEDEELEQNQKEKSKDDQKRITWAGCVNTRTPESRKKYCEVEFEKEESQILGCYKGFCDSCCDRIVDWIHPLHRFHCKQECEESTLASEENASWKQCIAIPRPQKSIYEYCEKIFKKVKERDNCKLDSCKLCCIMSQEFDHIDLKDYIVEKCQMSCLETFGNSKEIYIPF